MSFHFSSISDSIQHLLTNKQPFVFYRKSSSDDVSALLQKNTNLYTTNSFTETGFIFAPFDKNQKSILIPLAKSEVMNFILPSKKDKTNYTRFKEEDTSKNDYLHLIQKTIDFIHSRKADKVVISRIIENTYDKSQVGLLYENLLGEYPEAFVYVWYHPKVGLWMGATPEKLLSMQGDSFSTMALAGTQLFSNAIKWKKKEKEEQIWVTNFITDQLIPISDHLEISKPFSVQAGHLAHIQTDIKGCLKKDRTLQDLIKSLHPTPAVCGAPRNATKDFIIKNEKYNRTFYTGFLGELNLNQKTDLYVNLRCMRLNKTHAYLYVGGGITKDSIPEKEWDETVNKAAVLGKLLN